MPVTFGQVTNFKPVTREMLMNPGPDDWILPSRTCDAGVPPASVDVVGSQKPPFGSVTEITAADTSINALNYVRRASGLVLTAYPGTSSFDRRSWATSLHKLVVKVRECWSPVS